MNRIETEQAQGMGWLAPFMNGLGRDRRRGTGMALEGKNTYAPERETPRNAVSLIVYSHRELLEYDLIRRCGCFSRACVESGHGQIVTPRRALPRVPKWPVTEWCHASALRSYGVTYTSCTTYSSSSSSSCICTCTCTLLRCAQCPR